MSPKRLRSYVLILTRDIVPPGIGIFLAIAWADTLAPWQIPILAGLFGVLVTPRSKKRDGDED